MSRPVLLDACVIFPMPLCDTLLRIAEASLYRVHFSEEILAEATRNLVEKGRMNEAKAARYRSQIIATFPEALVDPPDELCNALTNHPGDRHVLAAAIHADAEIIVTENLRHFPVDALARWNIEAKHPDDFLSSLCDEYGEETLLEIIRQQADDCKKPPQSTLELLVNLEKKQPQFVNRLLLAEYATTIKKTLVRALTMNLIGKKLKKGEYSYQGKDYSISLVPGRLTISNRVNETVLSIFSERTGQNPIIGGSLTTKDVGKFLAFKQEFELCENMPAEA